MAWLPYYLIANPYIYTIICLLHISNACLILLRKTFSLQLLANQLIQLYVTSNDDIVTHNNNVLDYFIYKHDL